MGCLFGLFKLVYVVLSILILVDHCEYIYKWFQVFKPDTFFSNNQFAHTMGMFLGLLFRISGMLSAIKEKIALSTTYALFLLMILLLMPNIDFIFYLYLATAVYAFLYVIVLKYKRAKERRIRARANRALAAQQRQSALSTTGATQVALDLANGGSRGNAAPSAPPFEALTLNRNGIPQPGLNPNYAQQPTAPPPSELYFNPQHNTPPPSYSELYETK